MKFRRPTCPQHRWKVYRFARFAAKQATSGHFSGERRRARLRTQVNDHAVGPKAQGQSLA